MKRRKRRGSITKQRRLSTGYTRQIPSVDPRCPGKHQIEIGDDQLPVGFEIPHAIRCLRLMGRADSEAERSRHEGDGRDAVLLLLLLLLLVVKQGKTFLLFFRLLQTCL